MVKLAKFIYIVILIAFLISLGVNAQGAPTTRTMTITPKTWKNL